jgi:hypothetical protein
MSPFTFIESKARCVWLSEYTPSRAVKVPSSASRPKPFPGGIGLPSPAAKLRTECAPSLSAPEMFSGAELPGELGIDDVGLDRDSRARSSWR